MSSWYFTIKPPGWQSETEVPAPEILISFDLQTSLGTHPHVLGNSYNPTSSMVNYPSPYMLDSSLKLETEWVARNKNSGSTLLPNQKPQIRTFLHTATHLTFPPFPSSGQVAVRLSPSDPFPTLQSEDCLRQTHIYYAQVVIRKILKKHICDCHLAKSSCAVEILKLDETSNIDVWCIV